MYRGDGSFKTVIVKQQHSLLELLTDEAEYVKKYNDRAIAIELAKRNGVSSKDKYNELNKISEELKKQREKITEYLQNELNIKTSIGDKLYSETGKLIGYDNNRNAIYSNK